MALRLTMQRCRQIAHASSGTVCTSARAKHRWNDRSLLSGTAACLAIDAERLQPSRAAGRCARQPLDQAARRREVDRDGAADRAPATCRCGRPRIDGAERRRHRPRRCEPGRATTASSRTVQPVDAASSAAGDDRRGRRDGGATITNSTAERRRDVGPVPQPAHRLAQTASPRSARRASSISAVRSLLTKSSELRPGVEIPDRASPRAGPRYEPASARKPAPPAKRVRPCSRAGLQAARAAVDRGGQHGLRLAAAELERAGAQHLDRLGRAGRAARRARSAGRWSAGRAGGVLFSTSWNRVMSRSVGWMRSKR